MQYTRESLIRAVNQHAKVTLGPITLAAFCRAHKVSATVIQRIFPLGFPDFLAQAGHGDRLYRVRRATHNHLMAEFHRVARLLGRTPTRADIDRHARIRPTTFCNHLRNWKNITAHYEKWKPAQLTQLPVPCPVPGPVPVPRVSGSSAGPCSEPSTPPPTATPPSPAPNQQHVPMCQCENVALSRPASSDRFPCSCAYITGAPLDFRGTLFAPVNELGVILLTGALTKELGITIEHIGSAFPDCRALRIEKGAPNRYRRIAVEFELRSSNFKSHAHDPALCDLIICWDHDWPDCPIEVMPLKDTVSRLTGAA